jgi:hypothetical protein
VSGETVSIAGINAGAGAVEVEVGTEVLVGLGLGVARVTEIPVPNGITWQAESRIARVKTANNRRRIGVL